MGARYWSAWSLPLIVLLILTLPSGVARLDPDPEGTITHVQDEAQSAQEEAARQADEAQRRMEDGRARAQAEAEAQGEAARAQAQGALDFLLGLGIGLAQTVYNTAAHLVDEVWEKLHPIYDSLVGGPKRSQSSMSAQSAQASVVKATEVPAFIWIAASTGAAMLLLVLARRLIALGLIPLLSRIAHDEIYNNEARRNIHELVKAEPGLCLNDLVGRTGYSRNAVSYHLFVLEKEEVVVSVKDGKYRRYFVRNGKYVNGAKSVVAALRNATTLRLAQTVMGSPGAIQRDLCVALGATPSATCWHAKRLLDLGVIRKERVANTVQYFPGEAVARYDLSEFGLKSAAPMPAPA